MPLSNSKQRRNIIINDMPLCCINKITINMADPNITYLERDDISGVISKGLAVLYLEQPQFPIDFLAKWLLTYARNQKLKDGFKDEV